MLAVLLVATPAWAQAVDPDTGAPLEHVTIDVFPGGYYRVPELAPGLYLAVLRDTRGRTGEPFVLRVGRRHASDPAYVIDRRYLTDTPVPERTIDGVLGSGPRGVNDGYGAAFDGATSQENRYFIDGVDVTELGYGRFATMLPVELVDHVREIDVGAGPEYGRATGGFVDIATRRGTNELHGSVFGALAPSWLAASLRGVPHQIQTIEVSSQLAYTGDFGAELGGPIVKDHLWFYVAAAPQLARTDYTRRIESRTDCHVVDKGVVSGCEAQYADGQPDVDPRTGYYLTQTVGSEVRTAPATSVPLLARLDAAVTPEQQGSLTALVVPSASDQPVVYGVASSGTHTSGDTVDVGARWLAKLLDGRLELEVRAAWHHARTDIGAIDPSLASVPHRTLFPTSLADLAMYQSESPSVIAACSDTSASDRFPRITNCPLDFGYGYAIGGPGLVSRDIQDRRTARVGATAYLGTHELTAGLELDDEREAYALAYSGGYSAFDFLVDKLVDPNDNERDATALAGAAYVRDLWQIVPELVVDLGVRDDLQRLRYPAQVNEGRDLIAFDGRIEPRVGITYDPTREGRAKLFARWGRYDAGLPLALAVDLGAVLQEEIIDGTLTELYPAHTAIAGGLAVPTQDELVVGGQLAISPSAWASATFVDRRLHDVFEDIRQPDGTYLITSVPASRVYDALTLALEHRSARLYVRAAYTYSQTLGNYPGDIDYDDMTTLAHVSPLFDTPDQIANRAGLLPQDRTHVVKLDEAYTMRLGHDALVLGLRERAESGTPEIAYDYDNGVLLPRGAFGRTPGIVEVDAHVAYRRALSRGLRAELYADVFNLGDFQPATSVDPVYSQLPYSTRPISGGDYADLIWAKSLDFSNGGDTPQPVVRSTTFHHATAYAAPLTTHVGFRLAF